MFRNVCNILGKDKVNLFEQLAEEECSPERTDDFKALHKLYCYFKKNNFERKEKLVVNNTASQTDPPNLITDMSEIDIGTINEFLFLEDKP